MENHDEPANEVDQAPSDQPAASTARCHENRSIDPGPHSDKDNGRRKHPLDWAIAFFAFLAFVATSFAALYTRNQWLTAENTLIVTERAFVISNSVRLVTYGAHFVDGTPEWLVSAIIENVGNTPTRHLKIREVSATLAIVSTTLI